MSVWQTIWMDLNAKHLDYSLQMITIYDQYVSSWTTIFF